MKWQQSTFSNQHFCKYTQLNCCTSIFFHMHHHHRAVLNAAKDSRKAQKKEKNLKRVGLGLSGFLCIFAVIFLITQATHLSNSIEEAKVTYVYKICLCD